MNETSMHPAIITYSFLSEVLRELMDVIDLDVLYIPTAKETESINILSKKLNKNIVVYRKDHACKGVHLCRTLRPASLTDSELTLLTTTEKMFGEGQVIVAYERPLAFY